MTTREKIRIIELALKYLDSDITEQEFRDLEFAIASSQDAAHYYANCITNYFIISEEFGNVQIESDVYMSESIYDLTGPGKGINISVRGIDANEFLTDADSSDEGKITPAALELLEMEKNSPVIEIPVKESESEPEPFRKVDYSIVSSPRGPGPGKLQLFITFALAACLMIVVGIAYIMPEHKDRPVVGKLIDSIMAEWDSQLQEPDQDGLLEQSRYSLKRGYSTILFDDGAKVTIEAPAEFSLLSSGDMELFDGRIYAVVPPKAHGFSVKAKGNKLVDFGTEFGVKIDKSENVILQVTRGKVMLFAGLLNDKKKQIEVSQGVAKKVDVNGLVENLDLKENKFVSQIDSRKGTISKGRTIITDINDLWSKSQRFVVDKWQRHMSFYESADPDAEQGVIVSVYEGKYDSNINYDTVRALKKINYKLGDPKIERSSSIDFAGKNSKNYTYIINGFIEVPESGKYIFKVGWYGYQYNVMELNGRRVFERYKDDTKPTRKTVELEAGKRYPVKITYFTNTIGPAFWYHRVE